MNNGKRHENIQHMDYIVCKKDNGILLKDTTIKDLEDSLNLLNKSMTFNNH